MTVAQLLSNYRLLSQTSRKSFNFSTVIAELVTASLLAKDKEDNITDPDNITDLNNAKNKRILKGKKKKGIDN